MCCFVKSQTFLWQTLARAWATYHSQRVPWTWDISPLAHTSSSKQNPGPFSFWHPVRTYSMTSLFFVIVFMCTTFWGKGFGVNVDFANAFEVMVSVAGINLFHIEQNKDVVFPWVLLSLPSFSFYAWKSYCGRLPKGHNGVLMAMTTPLGSWWFWQNLTKNDSIKMSYLFFGDICKWNQRDI